ncbi:MAG: hypothetical protein M3440_04710 [Chloroflexota bacterium]|nr:hypothetical protein [Chloroflexota bacterium]
MDSGDIGAKVYLACYWDYEDFEILGVFDSPEKAASHIAALKPVWEHWVDKDGTCRSTLTYGPRFMGTTVDAAPDETIESIEVAEMAGFDPSKHFGVNEYEVQ